eukprot:6197466-Lingulodinium_polyedra.AAC.1
MQFSARAVVISSACGGQPRALCPGRDGWGVFLIFENAYMLDCRVERIAFRRRVQANSSSLVAEPF